MSDSVCDICGQPATSLMRMIPRRTETPACDAIRRAILWPGVELATTVHACKGHREAFRKAAQVVMQERPLDGDVTVRKAVD